MNPWRLRWIKLQRAWCYVAHWRGQVRHEGFGWHGWRCTRCGWMFFSAWTPEGQAMIDLFKHSQEQ